MKYIIVDTDATGEVINGYVKIDPMEGFIFTVLQNAATRFDSFSTAKRIADEHYNKGRKIRLNIRSVLE